MDKSSKAARFPLNVYLVREELSEALVSYVDVAGFPEFAKIKVGDDHFGELHFGRVESAPSWLNTLSSLAEGGIDLVRSASVSGVLIVEINDRTVVATFGHAWQRVKQRAIEPNFGIRCVMNLAEEDSLRAIRRDRVAEDSIQAIEQIPDHDDIGRFGMDIEKDLLRGVKARISEKEGFGAWVAGADSFKSSVDLSTESIASYLSRCVDLWKKSTYKKNFSWVDNIAPVKDADLEVELVELLARQVEAKNRYLSLCAPDLLHWDDFDLFSFERKKRSHPPCANYLDLEQWVDWCLPIEESITPGVLNEKQIYAYREDGVLAEKWPVMSCIHGLVERDEERYVAHAGHWYKLDTDFVARTNKRVDEIQDATIQLPSAKLKEVEGDYNLRAAHEAQGIFICLDKELTYHGGGKSSIEICDLFTDRGHLICVKPWGGSSGSLSHLFAQAKNTVELINNDVAFCKKASLAIANVNSGFSLVWDCICDDPKDAEVVLAILRGRPKEQLPFFAKLSLIDCVESIRRMRFRVSYTAIALA